MPDEAHLIDLAKNLLRLEASCSPAPWKTLDEFGRDTTMVQGSPGEASKRLNRNDLVLCVNLRNNIRALCEDYLRLRGEK